MDNDTNDRPEFSVQDPLPSKARDGESQLVEIRPVVCVHDDCVRVDSGTIECRRCGAGWIDHGHFLIENGKMLVR